MKRIGLIGGMGPASTLDYYTGILEGCRRDAATEHYPEMLIYSLDMTHMMGLVGRDRWDDVADILVQAAAGLASAGAECVAIACNMLHLVYDRVCEASPVPMMSIVEESCKRARAMGARHVLTIGTLFTMRKGLYTEPLRRYGLTPVLPDEQEQQAIYDLFFPNLENGVVIPEDKEKMLRLLNGILRRTDADALLLGCTELPLMIREGDLPVPLVNTTQVHIDAIVNYIAN